MGCEDVKIKCPESRYVQVHVNTFSLIEKEMTFNSINILRDCGRLSLMRSNHFRESSECACVRVCACGCVCVAVCMRCVCVCLHQTSLQSHESLPLSHNHLTLASASPFLFTPCPPVLAFTR